MAERKKKEKNIKIKRDSISVLRPLKGCHGWMRINQMISYEITPTHDDRLHRRLCRPPPAPSLPSMYFSTPIPPPLISCFRPPPASPFAWASQDDIMETAPRRFVKPLAPPVVAQRSEMEGLSQIKDFEVRLAPAAFCSRPTLDLCSLRGVRGGVMVLRYCRCCSAGLGWPKRCSSCMI